MDFTLRQLLGAVRAVGIAAAVLALCVSREVLQKGLRSFPGLAHRMEQVGRKANVLFVNDSKGTNADATEKALSSFADISWIAARVLSSCVAQRFPPREWSRGGGASEEMSSAER